MQVSIIMPYYNAAAYIRETVEAIIAQTYNDWELIIVDDCSPAPETAEAPAPAEGEPVYRAGGRLVRRINR